MNAYLWIGIVATGLLLITAVIDGLDHDGLPGPDWLSLAVLGAFVGGFGFVAGAAYPAMGHLAILPGLAGGAAFGYLGARLTRAAKGMNTGAADSDAGLLGSMGRVVTPVDESGGEVLLQRPHGPMKVSARAHTELPNGTQVVVIDVRSSTLVVVDRLELPELPH